MFINACCSLFCSENDIIQDVILGVLFGHNNHTSVSFRSFVRELLFCSETETLKQNVLFCDGCSETGLPLHFLRS